MNRATEIAENNGFGLVSLKNTTHWMRGGAYGWIAADKGYISICWTNTESCMPPWGSKSEAIGNNPFVMGVPPQRGTYNSGYGHVAIFIWQTLGTRDKGQKLPYLGGFDHDGKLRMIPVRLQKQDAFYQWATGKVQGLLCCST
jgi:3-dehydro-L-gulonate 2-dehydrogenase